jgi:pyruvate formate lyase activating enzyme
MVGRSMTASQVMAEIERDVIFYDQSGGGVTFTGGEPMLQLEFLKEILIFCQQKHIRTAVDTSGYTSWQNLFSIVPLVDLFLYDVKFTDETLHKKYTSVSNTLIINNLRKLSETGAHIVVRIPLVPGINDDDKNIQMCATSLAQLPALDGVELMPYHDIGNAKYQAIGMNYQLNELQKPTEDQVSRAEEILSSYGLPVIKLQGRVI